MLLLQRQGLQEVLQASRTAGYAEAVECEVSNKMIYVTEPRRITVTSSRVYTKIKFVTEGILIREMMGDPLLSNYSVIMLNEVHERTALIDIIMGLLKNILKRRREIKLTMSLVTHCGLL